MPRTPSTSCSAPGRARAPAGRTPATLDARLQRLLADVACGHDTLAALASAGWEAQEALTGLAELELESFVVRQAGGVYALTT